MSKLQFESLRHEISHIVHGSREPLSGRDLMPMCTLGDERQIVDALYNMCKDEQLTRHPAPEGSGRGVKWLYGPGKVKLGAIPPQNDAGGGDRPARKPPGNKPRKARAVKPSKKPRKNTKPLFATRKPVVDNSQTPLWALRSDGAFVLLGTQTEIQKPAARALVEFVRALDGGTA